MLTQDTSTVLFCFVFSSEEGSQTATLQTVHCCVIFRNLSFLPVVTLEAQQSKIRRLFYVSVRVCPCTRTGTHVKVCTGSTEGYPQKRLEALPPQWLPTFRDACSFLVILAATSYWTSFTCFEPSGWGRLSFSDLLQLLFLRDSTHNLSCLKSL